jgi:transcriptional regulator with XRE-family HTH domain
MDYGKMIKAERISQEMGVYRLSKKSGVPMSTIVNWELGHVPPVDKFQKVMNALGFELIIRRKENRQ